MVIKRHPNCKAGEMAAFIRNLVDGNIATETTSSIHDIIPGAQAVVTLNSGVGFESLLYEKPVVCLGRADYGGVAFPLRDTRTSATEMEEAFGFIMDGRPPKGHRQHLHVMLKKYQVDSRDETAFDRALLRALCIYHSENQMVL